MQSLLGDTNLNIKKDKQKVLTQDAIIIKKLSFLAQNFGQLEELIKGKPEPILEPIYPKEKPVTKTENNKKVEMSAKEELNDLKMLTMQMKNYVNKE